MASLRDAVKDNANELRDGIPWVVFWRDGRSWSSEAVYFSMDYAADTIDPDDIGRLKHINRTDPRAVALNGYYCGRLGENMTIDELARGVRWHYENGYNTLAGFIEEHDPTIPPAQLEAAREAAHAAGLPFSERPYDGRDFDPYTYDGSMTPEDYELMQNNIAQERSAGMNDPLSIQIHNRQRFESNQPGEWLKLPTTTEQLHAAMQRIGITAENQQDFFINGIDSQIETVARFSLHKVQVAGIDEMNYLAARLEQFDTAEIEKLNAAFQSLQAIYGEHDEDVYNLTEYVTNNTDFYVYVPGATDHAALGDYYLNKSQMVQMPEEWKAAVNVERLGQLAAENENGIFTDTGYILESGDEWYPLVEIPQEYRIMSFPQPEQSRAALEAFGNDFAQTMQAFYKEHPAYMETTEMANTSPSFIAHQIEVGHTFAYLDRALNALEAEPAYRDTALAYRQRLEEIRPQQPEQVAPGLTAEEAADLAGGRNAALRDIGDDPPIEYDAIATRAPAVATVQPPELATDEPQPVKVIALESEKPADKLKEITDKLESGIAGIFESEQYKEYLKTLSKFHDYSLNNTILIAMQKPDASFVAGFNTWKNEFERSVMKGQKGIKIIAPSPYKVKVKQEKTDPTTGKAVIGADGKPVTEETERKIPAFKVVSVFDVSQTEGKELPTIGADILTGDVEQYKDFFAALEKASPVPVTFENIEGSANGYYHQVDKRIAIDEGMSELQTLKTTIHEIAHARLHDVDKGKEQGEDEPPRADRRTREVEAESVAYTVCQHYGLDTSDYSFGYVAGWSSGKELTELKASLETIRTTAAELITEIDGHFAELQQDRAQTADHERQAAPERERQQGDTYAIYQLKGDDSTRDFRFEPYERLQAAGLSVDPTNYVFVYSGQLGRDETLDNIFEKFNISRPADFTGHSLSMSDVVTLNRDGKETAHYVDRFGFKDVPEFLHPEPAIYMQQTAAEPIEPDSFLTGEKVKTPRGSFSLTDMTKEQMNAAGYGFHHSSDDGKYNIMANGTRAFAIENPLRTAEMSTEQNMNMIDGVLNNTPSVGELEARAKAGERINLSDLAAAIKAEKVTPDREHDKKPSIRAQLKQAGADLAQREKTAPSRTQDKNHLEV